MSSPFIDRPSYGQGEKPGTRDRTAANTISRCASRPPARGPLFPDQGPLGSRVKRRTIGSVGEIGGFILLTVLSPLLMLVALLIDIVLWFRNRRPFVTIRMVPAIWWFLFGEMKAYLKLIFIYVFTGGPWGRGSIRRRRWIYALRIAWARNHLIAIRILFGLKFDLEGEENTAPGPVHPDAAPRQHPRQPDR